MTFPASVRPITFLFFLAIAIPNCVHAQQTDPWGGGSASGATGLQPMSPPSGDTGSTSRADERKLIQFRSETTIVQVPVVVTDKAGNHIHGLTKADFKVLENGKPQNIAGFEEVVTDRSASPATVPATGVFTNASANANTPRSLTVMVLDEVNTPFLSQAYAREQLVKYLANHLKPSQPVGLMVIGGKGLEVLSGIDADPNQLIAALKKATGHVSTMESFSNDAQAVAATGNTPSGLSGGINANEPPDVVIRQFIQSQSGVEAAYSQARAIDTTLRAFLEMAWLLSGTPGRKSVVWVTGSFPFYLDSFTSVPGDNGLRALYERTLKALNDAQISVYPVDARGLLTDPTFAGDYDGSLLGPGAPGALRQSTVDSLKTFAEMTGGIAYYNTNDLAGAFDRAVQDSSSYYLLGYYLDRRDNKPGWRRLQVEVTRKDVEVRARAGYLLTNVSSNPELTQKADIDLALLSPYESTGIPIAEQWQDALGKGAKKKIGFVLRVPATGLIDEADKNYVDLEFVAQATRQGAVAATVSQPIKGMVVPETLAKLKTDGVLYHSVFDLAPGDYQVHFVVRDNLSGRIGSLIVPLTVK